MNKKILAAAVAAAMVAPAAALANDVTVYGIAHISIDYLNDGSDAWNGFDVASRASRLGFKGTEDLANGLKAIWKMEFQVDMADAGSTSVGNSPSSFATTPNVAQGSSSGRLVNQSTDLITARNAYVGLAGGWGTFLVGRHDTPFKMSTGKLDLFSDELWDYNSAIGFVDIRTNSAIAYVSPNWSGLSFAGAMVAPHVYSKDGDGNTYDSDGLADAYSLALTYDNAGFFASVAYEVLTQDWLQAWASQSLASTSYSLQNLTGDTANCSGVGTSVMCDPFGGDVGASTSNANVDGIITEDNTKWRAGLGWTGAGFTIGGIYEWDNDILGIKGADADKWQVQAGYTFGNNMVKAMYGQTDYNTNAGGSDSDAWAIGLNHNFSKRTTVYMEYGQKDYDNGDDLDRSGFSLGMIHKF